jgi:hypothetical protein
MYWMQRSPRGDESVVSAHCRRTPIPAEAGEAVTRSVEGSAAIAHPYVRVARSTSGVDGPYTVRLIGSNCSHTVTKIDRIESAVETARDLGRIHGVRIEYDPPEHFSAYTQPATIAQLGTEYSAWLSAKNLPTDSVPRELLLARWDDLSWDDRTWLFEFIRRWEAAYGAIR